MDELIRHGWVEEEMSSSEGNRVYLRPTEVGAAGLAARGVTFPAAKSGKPVAFCCLDWTERRWHLGGAMGRAIVDALVDAECIRRSLDSRVVELADGLEQFLVGR